MKLVFFSVDELEVKQVAQELAHAGIHCRMRVSSRIRPAPREAELWLLNDADYSRAFLLCVEAGVGFGKRKHDSVELEFWDDAIVASATA